MKTEDVVRDKHLNTRGADGNFSLISFCLLKQVKMKIRGGVIHFMPSFHHAGSFFHGNGVATTWVGLGVEVVGYGRKERPYLLITNTTGPVRRGEMVITSSTSAGLNSLLLACEMTRSPDHKCNNYGFHADVLIHPSSPQPSFPTS